MILKKFYGSSIKEARQHAMDELGDECIVLETKNTSGKDPAVVTVMVDKPKKNKVNVAKKSAINQTYSRKSLIPKALTQVGAAVTEGLNRFSSNFEDTKPGKPKNNKDDHESLPETKDADTLIMSRRSTPLYNGEPARREKSDSFRQQFTNNLKEPSVSKEVKALHRRFDHMENLLSEALISANLKYVSHPAFQQLLNTGMQAPMISRWFEEILNKGIDPHEQSKSFMFELAEIVRSSLSFALPEAPEKNLLFVGPAGSGKTSLIMKLATNPEFMLNKSIALVSLEPQSNFKRYSTLKLFADDIKVPYYRIQDGVDASKLLPQLQEFDHVLFDTPSISLQKEAALRDFWRIRQMLASVTPLEVHYVVNATLERYYFKESYAENHPLQPDYIAISHLDETQKWGHLLPFLKGRECNVRYVSQGPNVPDDLQTFKPSWFAEHILSQS